jgi:hypothetical protein
MRTADFDHTSEVVLSLLQELIDALAARFLAIESQGAGDLAGAVAAVAAGHHWIREFIWFWQIVR